MEKTSKTIKRDYYNALIVAADNGVDFGTISAEQMKTFAKHEIELLDKKKASAKANPNSKTTANDELRDKILNALAENPDRKYTITDMQKEFDFLEGKSNQSVSALVRPMVESGDVERIEEKRKAYFKIVG
jgi:hypothetical protein